MAPRPMTAAMPPSVAPRPSWNAFKAASGDRPAPTPTSSAARSSARKAFTLRHVTSSTRTTMAPSASRRSEEGGMDQRVSRRARPRTGHSAVTRA